MFNADTWHDPLILLGDVAFECDGLATLRSACFRIVLVLFGFRVRLVDVLFHVLFSMGISLLCELLGCLMIRLIQRVIAQFVYRLPWRMAQHYVM